MYRVSRFFPSPKLTPPCVNFGLHMRIHRRLPIIIRLFPHRTRNHIMLLLLHPHSRCLDRPQLFPLLRFLRSHWDPGRRCDPASSPVRLRTLHHSVLVFHLDSLVPLLFLQFLLYQVEILFNKLLLLLKLLLHPLQLLKTERNGIRVEILVDHCGNF